MLRDYLPIWAWLSPLAGWLLLAASLGYAHPLFNIVIGLGLVACVLAAVHHAEVVAHRVGEPFGTLVLALAVTIIEVALIVSLMVALRLATLQGVGVCQLPTFVVQEDLRAGKLIDVLPGWAPRSGIIHAAFPSRRGLLPSVRALLDRLASEYAALDQTQAV